MSNRHWYDSFPGIKLDDSHPILDFYGTPYGGPERSQGNYPIETPFDEWPSGHAPYTIVAQNRGGIA